MNVVRFWDQITKGAKLMSMNVKNGIRVSMLIGVALSLMISPIVQGAPPPDFDGDRSDWLGLSRIPPGSSAAGVFLAFDDPGRGLLYPDGEPGV